jgi:glycosyltransferase involved in cell wall biosynthesis
LNLLVVTPYFDSHRGGVELVAGQLAREFRRLGQNVAWLATDATPAPTNRDACDRAIAVRAFNLSERRFGIPFPLPTVSALRQIGEEVRRADVIVLHDSLYLTNLAAFLLARRTGTPVVITQHIGAVSYRNPLLRSLMSLANKWIARRLLSRAEQVIFISEVTARYFDKVRFRVPPKLIFNGVDTHVFHPLREPAHGAGIRHRLGLPSGQPVVLFVGRFVEKKGLHFLERLARLEPDVTFAFAGWGPLDPRKWSFPNVHVFPDLTGGSLAQLYQASDLFLLPSVGEGFPLVLQEALACGLPVICGAETAEADPEARRFLRAVPINNLDVDGTTRTLRAAVKDALAKVGRGDGREVDRFEFVSKRYSWSRSATLHLELLQAALGCIRCARPTCPGIACASPPSRNSPGAGCRTSALPRRRSDAWCSCAKGERPSDGRQSGVAGD